MQVWIGEFGLTDAIENSDHQHTCRSERRRENVDRQRDEKAPEAF